MKSIRSQLLFWLMLPLTIVAAIVAIETFVTSQKTSNDLHDKSLLAASLAIYENVIASNGNLLAEDTLKLLTETLGDQYFYHVSGPNSSFVAGYSGYPRLPDDFELQDNTPHFYDAKHLDNPVRVIVFRQNVTGRQLNGLTTITTWQRITQRNELTFDFFGRSLLRLILLVASAGLIVWFAISKGLKPLLNLQNAIESRSPYDLTPIKRRMPLELSGIVSSMNSLFNRVAVSKSNRERFIGDAAHQLRNPIAALIIQAETALISKNSSDQKQGLKHIIETTNQTGRLVEHMLSSASAYAMDTNSGTVFDLCEVVSETAREMAPKALEKGQEFSLETGNEKQLVMGRSVLMREAILNLLDNAIKYSPNGSQIAVSVSESNTEGFIEVSISDQGKVINEEELLKLSQPFSTGDYHNSGSGLGLSVTKDIAKSHSGWITVQPNFSSIGKTISIVLPALEN